MKDSEDHPDNTKLVHEGWNSIREKKRGYVCSALLISALVAYSLLFHFKQMYRLPVCCKSPAPFELTPFLIISPHSCSLNLQLLLLAMWVGMTFVGLVSLGAIEDDNLRAGNPYRLTNAMDYNGNICGYDSSVKNKKYGYYLPDYTGTIRSLH